MRLQMEEGLEENERIQLARKGSREAFDTLLSSILPGLSAAARRLAGNEAEDLVQDCLADAFRGIGTLQTAEAWRGWVYQILVRRNIDRLRRRRPDVAREEPVDELDPLAGLLHGELKTIAGRSLESLDERLRSPLTLRYHHDLSLKEIAERTRQPLGTVKSLIHEGLRALDRAVRARIS